MTRKPKTTLGLRSEEQRQTLGFRQHEGERNNAEVIVFLGELSL